MIKIRRTILVLIIILRSSLSEKLSDATTTTTDNHLHTTKFPHIDKSDSKIIAAHKANSDSSPKTAESRLFPIGHPSLIQQPGGLVSPFDVATFSNSLLPLISAGIREKVKDVAQSFSDGVDLVEETIRDGWRVSPLNPHNFEAVLNRPPNLFKHLPFGQPNSPLMHPQHAHHKHHQKQSHRPHHGKDKTNTLEPYTNDDVMNEYGIHGYKHFEESILREIEKQEEAKVEATIHTLFNEGDRVEIVRGKPYFEGKEKAGWKPVPAPTKIYDDGNEITSQIISPLHTSIFHASDALTDNSFGFHDFDQLNHHNSIHSAYGASEEGDETKVKPVKAKIASIRRITPQPPFHVSTTTVSTTVAPRSTTLRSRASSSTTTTKHSKRRQFAKSESSNKVAGDASTSASNIEPVVITASVKRIPPPPSRAHIQSLTTSKPKNHANIVRNFTEVPHSSSSAASEPTTAFENTPRVRVSTPISTRVTRGSTTTTTTTTKRPSRTVQREVSRFVDRARATGFRGSVKYGQSTTKQNDQN